MAFSHTQYTRPDRRLHAVSLLLYFSFSQIYNRFLLPFIIYSLLNHVFIRKNISFFFSFFLNLFLDFFMICVMGIMDEIEI